MSHEEELTQEYIVEVITSLRENEQPEEVGFGNMSMEYTPYERVWHQK